MNPNQFVKSIRRRRLIQGMGWFSGSLLLAKGCALPGVDSVANSSQAPSGTSQTPSSPAGTASDSCVLYPEQVEGPYYVDLDLVRQDITEGKEGVPLRLVLQVTDAQNCAPISGAAVDIWHCDAAGNYAGYSAAATSPPDSGYGAAANPAQPPSNASSSGRPAPPPSNPFSRGRGSMGQTPTNNETFLRGTQITDADGQVEFDTIYPGWYPGRAVHIHLKVHLDSNTVLTSQVYFPDEVTSAVYAQAPYNSRPNRNTTNDEDFILGNNQAVLLSLSEAENGYTGRLAIGVAR